MATPEASVHLVKNRLRYHFAVYPTNESCSQKLLRRIMMLRSLIKILLASYSSKCYWGQIVISRYNRYPVSGITYKYIPEQYQSNTVIQLDTGIPPTPSLYYIKWLFNVIQGDRCYRLILRTNEYKFIRDFPYWPSYARRPHNSGGRWHRFHCIVQFVVESEVCGFDVFWFTGQIISYR